MAITDEERQQLIKIAGKKGIEESEAVDEAIREYLTKYQGV